MSDGKYSDEELVEILDDWYRYAHGIGKIGYCNDGKCQAALNEIKARVQHPQQLVEYQDKDGSWKPVTKLVEIFPTKKKSE